MGFNIWKASWEPPSSKPRLSKSPMRGGDFFHTRPRLMSQLFSKIEPKDSAVEVGGVVKDPVGSKAGIVRPTWFFCCLESKSFRSWLSQNPFPRIAGLQHRVLGVWVPMSYWYNSRLGLAVSRWTSSCSTRTTLAFLGIPIFHTDKYHWYHPIPISSLTQMW